MADDMAVFDPLKLENQLCFPLYAAARGVIRRYRPLLSALDLTYTQYIAMMVLWEKKCVNVGELGEKLYLDSGTLTPLLKTLESKGYITRARKKEDERVLQVTLTPAGAALREKALAVPAQIGSCLRLKPGEAAELYRLLHLLLEQTEP